jgi:adenylate cyclase
VHEQVRDKVKAVFADKGEVALKNIARPVQIFSVAGAPAGDGPGLALPDKPSIAVLPFQNMSGDPEQEYFADGMVEDIITALSRFRQLFVIARNSSFAYKGQSPDVRKVGRELGVRYVLEGSVRRAGNRVRITGQLIEAANGAHLWADRFDGALEDLFALQDRVSESVVGRIVPALDRAEIERAKRKPPGSLDAYDFYLRGRACLADFSPASQDEALVLFRRAVALDPDLAPAWGTIARVYSMRRMQLRVVDRAQEEAEARRAAWRVRDLASDDSRALVNAGHALFTTCNEPEVGAALVDRALAINPGAGMAWSSRSWISMLQGDQERAVEEAARALRLNPLEADGIAGAEGAIAYARFFQGRDEEAWQAISRALLHAPAWVVLLQIAVAISAMAGRSADTAAAVARLRAQAPALRISNINQMRLLQRPEDRTRLVEGLRRAGFPE